MPGCQKNLEHAKIQPNEHQSILVPSSRNNRSTRDGRYRRQKTYRAWWGYWAVERGGAKSNLVLIAPYRVHLYVRGRGEFLLIREKD